ncbi:MAG: hypothetical protein COT85_02120 [Chlamydiae bacterium CG10_big_fil_rev_8_21_14_0_10_42_34]|nr:MAG: hypothetical protein COT85_02120 [Chlamydiae bacterium CG10_big_fil_rev_8_21_14_0_10_42_34]
MKRTFFLAASAISAAFTNGEQMKLVNTKTGFVVVEFTQGKAEFHDRFLEAEMKETGILIPPALASSYANREVIFLNDPLFEKAFIEVYYPLCIANCVYQWQN